MKRHARPALGALPPKVSAALQKTWDASKRAAKATGRGVKRAAKAAHGAACKQTRKELEAPSVALVLRSGNKDKLARSLRAARWSFEKTCRVKL